MEMKFRVFVQERRDGNVSVQVLEVPVTGWGNNADAALSNARDKLTNYVRHAQRRSWSQPIFQEAQELRSLPLELVPKSKHPHDPIPITVSLLVTTEHHSRGTRYIVTAPAIPDFHLVVNDATALEEQARGALLYHTRKWKSAAIVEADQSRYERLEIITIEVFDAAEEAADELSNSHDQEDVLGLCGLNLSEQAAAGRLGRAERRDALVEQLLTTLASETMSSAMLIGRGDVGKTALLHEVVERIRSGNVPQILKGREVWFVTANNLVAGMKYTGEWQGRTQMLIAQARKGRQILYMADPYEIIVAGRWSGSDNNMGRFLRPYIESGELTIICECTPETYDATLKAEPGFVNVFHRIDVPETDEADTLAIVGAAARRMETTRNVSIDPAATAAALNLTRRFMPYRAFPGKAVRFVEQLVRDALPGQERSPTLRSLGREDAIASFTRATGLPPFILSDELAMRVPQVRAFFEERLLGQPDAVTAMVDLVTVIKAGLNDPHKPLGSFFFVGPTGVGKTELAKVLAEFLFGSRERMVRFDMSEYASEDAVPRLIGSAWKADSEGELTRRVREQPFCVILFDELEKAHREVFDVLLGVLGEGRLTDAGGRSADFRNAIIIMTSNLGASRREMQGIGFGQTAEPDSAARLEAHFVKEAEQFFRPEFFNRIDRIVAFRALDLDAVRRITRRELGKLLMREGVVRRNLLVETDDEVIEKLLTRGFHPLYGARPLQREIERMVILPLARLVVEQAVDHRKLIHFRVRDDQIDLSLVPLELPDETADVSPAPPADRRLETDIAGVLRAIGDLRLRSAAEEATSNVQGLRRLVSALLERTHEPSFWDDPTSAREVLSRVYHLERVLKRLDVLTDRAEFLEEKARQIKIHRDRRGVGELARDVERLTAEFAYVQMEVAGASAGFGRDHALLRVTPVGRESEAWAAQIAAMYRAWAARKGYDYQVFEPAQSADESERSRSRSLSEPITLYLKGSNVFEFLRGEAGLHKLTAGAGEERQRNLARVTVLLLSRAAVDQSVPGENLAALLGMTTEAADGRGEAAPIVRLYHQGRYRFVRDPRTGVRQTDVVAVLRDGQIDPFLLATLQGSIDAAEPAVSA